MIPTLSCLSVSIVPGGCLRHRRSFRYLRISPLHRKFRHPLTYSSSIVCDALPRLSPGLSHHTHKTPTHPLRPVNPINARTLCITAAAGTEFAGAYSVGTVKVQGYYPRTLLPNLKSFTTRRPSSLTRHRWIRVAPIVQYSPLLPPVGVWAVSQSQCDWSSSQTSYRSSPW